MWRASLALGCYSGQEARRVDPLRSCEAGYGPELTQLPARKAITGRAADHSSVPLLHYFFLRNSLQCFATASAIDC